MGHLHVALSFCTSMSQHLTHSRTEPLKEEYQIPDLWVISIFHVKIGKHIVLTPCRFYLFHGSMWIPNQGWIIETLYNYNGKKRIGHLCNVYLIKHHNINYKISLIDLINIPIKSFIQHLWFHLFVYQSSHKNTLLHCNIKLGFVW